MRNSEELVATKFLLDRSQQSLIEQTFVVSVVGTGFPSLVEDHQTDAETFPHETELA
ncbi:hypothetical protein SAMN06265222_11826 [Neorhodopirellula lusitana]|uniref:Uncharacterized protein n=1 Tax=Neorhodopirellula lusitana TaxID=445327 RepID=A0ABY1QM60_9BACT|nr:hypothetical protein SAMN06265222_11826 [Neorhodopirellula lusitana]